jgi:hypothetical protein
MMDGQVFEKDLCLAQQQSKTKKCSSAKKKESANNK